MKELTREDRVALNEESRVREQKKQAALHAKTDKRVLIFAIGFGITFGSLLIATYIYG